MTASLAAFTSSVHGHCKISVAFTIMYILFRGLMDEHISKRAREGGFRLSVTKDATLGKARLRKMHQQTVLYAGMLLEMMHHSGVPVTCTPVSEIYAQRYCTYIA